MRYLTCRHEGRLTWGVLTEDNEGVIDLGKRFPQIPDLSAALANSQLSEIHNTFSGHKPDFSLSEVTFERTIFNPRKNFCIGVNYGGRGAE